jgi:ABC-type transport system substrate-binding protein
MGTFRRITRSVAETSSLMVLGLAVLVTSVPAAEPKGTLRVAAKADMTTLDPANAIDYQSWVVVEQMFNGLYNFDKDGRTYPDLAEALPRISPDGLTYTITLRKGVRFHHGREVDAEDVKFSFERTLTPATKSWGQRFLAGIDGAKEMLDGAATELRGLKVIDRHTVQIRLKEPQGVFLSNLGPSTGFILPRDVVRDRGAAFGQKPVGTGPYRFVEWMPGQRFAMERNPDYFVKGVPKIERIEYTLGVDPAVALLKLERGEVDFLADGIPSAEYPRIMNDPRLRELVGSGPLYVTHWLGVNVTMKPFDDVRVRRALAYAIDKDRLIRLLRGQAVRADGLLPPGVPGHKANRPRIPYSPQEAKALLAAAGHPTGFKTELYFRPDAGAHKAVAEAIQQDLKGAGIEVELRPLAASALYAAVGKPGTVPMGLSSKGANYPDPYDYLSHPTCPTAQPGTRYPSYYCNQAYDELIRKAETLGTDPAARLAVYQQAEDLLLQELPAIFLYNAVQHTMHSPRLKDFYVHPIFLWWWRDYNLAE